MHVRTYTRRQNCALHIRLIRYGFIDYLLNVSIMLTLPVTTVTAECSFSQLRHLETYLRNAIAEEPFNSLTWMSIHCETKLPTNKIISEFAEKKTRR